MGLREFFKGKNLFMTGGSGFLGKVLIEKLLRSCPDVGNIYVLIRSKRNKSPQDRWNEITKNCLFDKLKETHPENLKKVIVVEGDVCELGLGINETDRKTLTENVDIIYHMAASVRFDDSLNQAIFANVRSTRETIILAKEMKNLSVFVHVSTSYSNCDKLVVEEKIYPSHGNWKEAIQFAEEADQQTIDAMTLKYIHPHPNTYTYCKSLAEQTVKDMCTGQIPTVIVRPSIVISTLKDPLQGWNDNFNGPVGLLVAGGKGLIRTALTDPDVVQDYVVVDAVVRLLLRVASEKSKYRNSDEIDVYNASKYKETPITNKELIDMGQRMIADMPFSQMLWYPRPSYTTCWYNYYIQVLLFHMLPAIFVDILLRIIGQKPMLFTIQRKVYIANNVLLFFIMRNFLFVNNNSLALLRNTPPEDRDDFGSEGYENHTPEDVYEYFKNSATTVGKILLKEDYSDIEKNRRNFWRLWVLDVSVKAIVCSILYWTIFIKYNFIKYIVDGTVHYFERL